MSEKPPRPRSSKPKSTKSTKSAEPDRLSQERFVQDLVARGQAARRDKDGNLPAGVTHEIVDDPEGGPPKIVRRRFSIS